MSTASGAGSSGNHKIKIRQGDKTCTTDILTTGPWAGETYHARTCMVLDLTKCVTFEVLNDSYYDPSQVRQVKFVHKDRARTFTYDVRAPGQGWFHSSNIREHKACTKY